MQSNLFEEEKTPPKFPNCEGFFWLEGVKIKWELKAEYIGEMYHFDFNSYCIDNEELKHTEYKIEWKEDEGSGRVPNLLTETGYRSYFPNNLDCYDSVEEHLEDYLKCILSHDEMGKPPKKRKEYRLTFEDDGYSPSQQTTLIQSTGGKN